MAKAILKNFSVLVSSRTYKKIGQKCRKFECSKGDIVRAALKAFFRDYMTAVQRNEIDAARLK